MTKKFCVYDNDDNVKVVNINGKTEKEIQSKLLGYIIKIFNMDVSELLEGTDIYYSEIEEEDYE